MEIIIIYIILIGLITVVKASKRAKKVAPKTESQTVPNRTYHRETSVSRNAAVAKKVEAFKYRTTHADENYDDHMLDYCDSDLPATTGITFKEMPAGMDELLYLRRYNRQREKQLERELMNQDGGASIRLN